MWAKYAMVSLFLFSMSVSTGWAQINWLDDLSAAKATATAAEKDLLVFVSDGDSLSVNLEEGVFQQEALVAVVNKDFVAVKLEIAEDSALVKTFKSDYGPLQAPVVFLADASGQPYGRIDEVIEEVKTYLDRLAFEREYRPLVDAGGTWLDNYEMARAKAKAQGKHLLMLFTGSDWCPACIMMERNIFSKAAFEEAIGDDFVLVKFDFPRRKTLPEAVKRQNDEIAELFAQKHGFRGYPTVYLAHSDGTPYAQVGPVNMEPKAYAEMLMKGRRDEQKQSR